MLGQSVSLERLPAAPLLDTVVFSADSAAELDGPTWCVDLSADRADVPTLAPPVILNESSKLVEMAVAAADHPMRYAGRVENVPASTLRDPAYLQSFVGKPVLFGEDHPRDASGALRPYTFEADVDRKIGVVVKSWFDEAQQVQKVQAVIDTPQGLQSLQRVRGVSPAYMKAVSPTPGLTADGKRFDAIQSSRSDVDHVLVTPNPRGGLMTWVRGADTQDVPMDPVKLAAALRKLGMNIEADADTKEDAFAKMVGDAFADMKKAKDEESADAVAAVETERDAWKTKAEALEADAATDHTMAHYLAVKEVEASADALGVADKVDLSKCATLDDARKAVLKAASPVERAEVIDGLSGDAVPEVLAALTTLHKGAKPAPKPTPADPLAAIRDGVAITPTVTPSGDTADQPCAFPFSAGA